MIATRKIVASTPEKLDFALRNNPGLLDDVSLIVLDEGHMLGPSEREIRYEVLVQRLLRRSDASKRRLVCLSAMLPSGDELSDFVSWIRSDEPGEPIWNEWRPTRLRYGEITWHSSFARYELRIEDETSLPENWEQIAAGWLLGETVSSLRKISEDAVSFVEDALVYRLVWAVEAIRVRSRANEEELFGEHPSLVVAAIETGTVLIPASILEQAGLPSRVAAIKTLEDFPTEFETLSDMRQWLFSDEVQAATNSRNWPTRDTTVIWKDFVDQQRTAPEAPKRIYEMLLRANFVDGQAISDIGTPVLILKRKDGEQPKIYSPDVRLLGVTLDKLPVQVGDWVMGYINNQSTVRIPNIASRLILVPSYRRSSRITPPRTLAAGIFNPSALHSTRPISLKTASISAIELAP